MGNSKPRIGIIGGAGPMAGALLFEKIIQICQEKYGCSRDADFPYVLLLNYPFDDMLTKDRNKDLLESQLEECFNCLLKNDISIAAIACNTLHAFLPSQVKNLQFVHLIEETGVFLKKKSLLNPLVLCTSTSAAARLHEQFFSCRYPEMSIQGELDIIIDRILAGECLKNAGSYLNSLCGDGTTLLGCTELSLLNERAPLNLKNLCDPNAIAAEKICHLIFNK